MTQNGDAVGGAFFQQSSFASHALATERNTVVVPDEAPLEILGPLGCGIQTGAGAVLNSFDMRAGASFAVFGAGAVGLSAVMAAVLAGAGPIIATDINAERLALALELGATHTIDAATGDVAGQIQTITGGGADFALETSSDEQAFHDLLECLALGGTCGVVATPRRGQPFPFSSRNLLVRAPTVMGILQGSSVPELFIPRLVELQRSGRFPIERLVTFYEFADINVAVADAEAGRAIKPILRIS
jgi:aryl-alcohol dehydrogenase